MAHIFDPSALVTAREEHASIAYAHPAFLERRNTFAEPNCQP